MSPKALYLRALALAMLLGVLQQALAQPTIVTVSLSAPGNGSQHSPGNINLDAMTTVASGYSISKVEFFSGTTLVGTDTVADSPFQYSVTWNAPQGNHTITAKATAVKSGSPDETATSSPRSIVVSVPPAVSITSHTTLSNVDGPNLTVNVSASDSDGTIERAGVRWRERVNNLDIGSMEVTQPPYSFPVTLNTPELGIEYVNYLFTAYAYDNQGRLTETPITLFVGPSIKLTSPANGATFTAPATITLNASYSVGNASLSKIEFFDGSTLIGQILAPAAPYTFNWQNVPVGTYSLTAKATATGGWTRASAPISVTVTSGEAQLHFIHVDHLNTPRRIYDASQQLVWSWENQEPFGDTPPDENPSGLGVFEFPKRFDGQYADKETGLFHNYFRDYNPALPIFLQSDPLGLRAGLNTYVYAFDPLTQTDPFGLMGRGPAGNSKGGPPARNPNKAGCGPSGGFWNPFVPNNPMGFPFEPCCDAHDKCYDNCQGPDKLGCDMQGCSCFSGTCKSYAGYVQSACQWAAQQYCYQIMYSSSSDEQFKKARANCGGKCKPQ